VAKEKKKYWFMLGFLFFAVYIFIAARPIPVETVLTHRWIASLESNYPDSQGEGPLLPFQLGDRFGYVDPEGHYAVNQVKKGYVELSDELWTEYEAVPETLTILDPRNNPVVSIENGQGYPKFLDKRVFLIHNEQTAVSEADPSGKILWTYDFEAPLTCIDAAAGLTAVGTLDGSVEVLNGEGRLVFSFVPGASRIPVILNCRLSNDGSRLAIISGIEDQRFLLLERFGDSYRVVYHEFLEDGFRRAVYLAFVDQGNRIVFEREGALGIYEINARNSLRLPLEGNILVMDETGSDGILFIVMAQAGLRKNLVAVRFPGTVIINAPFQSEEVFLRRYGRRLYIGGGMTMAAFELDNK
jgi:hypothetical protein